MSAGMRGTDSNWASSTSTFCFSRTNQVQPLHAVAQMAIRGRPTYGRSAQETVQQTFAATSVSPIPLVSVSSSHVAVPVSNAPKATDGT